MQQLSGTDNVMLFAERRNIFNHVGALMVYDVTTAPEGKVRFKDIVRHFDARMHLHPLFRRRLVQVPFGLDRPYWVADEELDIEYHLRHIALPKPGDWRQLMIQVARLHSRPLDRAHPLWEAYVIEGLDNIPKLPPGAFAMFLKIHHAVVDGMAAVHLMRELHASTPDADGWPSSPPTIHLDREPTSIELLARSLESVPAKAGRIARLSARIGARLLAAGRDQWPEVSRGEFKAISGQGGRPDSGTRARHAVQQSGLAASRGRRDGYAAIADCPDPRQGAGSHDQRRIRRRRRRRGAQVPRSQGRVAGRIVVGADADLVAQ